MKNLEIQQAQGIAGPENAFHVRNPETGEIFATCKGSRGVNQFETEKRARAFAAVGELLDALTALTSQAEIDATAFPKKEQAARNKAIARARAAILKAECGK